jgi:two-component system, LytTR family, sensor kinase
MRALVIHVLVCTIVFALLLVYHRTYSFDGLLSTAIVSSMADIGGLYASALVINRYLVPRLLYQKQSLLFILLLILLFILVSILIQKAEWVWYMYKNSLSEESKPVFRSVTFQLFNTYITQFLGCLCICAYRLVRDQRLSQTRYEILQKEKAQAELNFLKAQINPHFLFNSINSLYAEIDKTNTGARNIVLKFSEMLRYQLYECSVEKIAIEKEVEYLGNYVALERLRKEDSLRIGFDVKGNLSGFTIAPLLFITFIENAFKYASTYDDRENSIEISLERMDSQIVFKCRNSKDRLQSRHLADDSGIGIHNVKRRLELLYPGRHQLVIENEELFFKVFLTIETR